MELKVKSRAEFGKKYSSLYRRMLISAPEVLDKIFPLLNNSNANKTELLKLAASGGDKPSQKTKIGSALRNYTSPSHHAYDLEFTAKIKALAPQWFLDTVAANKTELLKLAASGGDKPLRKTKIDQALYNYASPSSNCYDLEFTAKIKALAPQWFLDTVAANKTELLKLAASGGDKPSQKTKIGKALGNYTQPSSVSRDLEFTAKIKALAPHWFNKTKKDIK